MNKILTSVSESTGQKVFYDGRGFILRPEYAVTVDESRAKYVAALVSEQYRRPIAIEDAPE